MLLNTVLGIRFSLMARLSMSPNQQAFDATPCGSREVDVEERLAQREIPMIARGMQGVADMWSLKTGLLAAVAVLGLTMSAQAQCSGGGQGGGSGQMSGRSVGGMGLGGTGMGGMGNNNFNSQSSMIAAQMETAQYLNNMQASHNMMMQQIHQHQNRQRDAMRQASANRKRIAAQKATEISSKSKSKSSSSSSAKSIQLTQSN